jgi:hypothetical protein
MPTADEALRCALLADGPDTGVLTSSARRFAYGFVA